MELIAAAGIAYLKIAFSQVYVIYFPAYCVGVTDMSPIVIIVIMDIVQCTHKK